MESGKKVVLPDKYLHPINFLNGFCSDNRIINEVRGDYQL